MTKAFLACSLLFAHGQLAHASEAKNFLEDLEGRFKGMGAVTVGPDGNKQRVSCSVKNQFDEGGLALAVNGRCATTQGKVKVAGELEVKGSSKIEGSFISASNNSEVTKSSSTFRNGTLVLSMYQRDKATGNLSKTRQVVSKNGKGGFKSVFYSYDNASGSYQETGNVNFVPK